MTQANRNNAKSPGKTGAFLLEPALSCQWAQSEGIPPRGLDDSDATSMADKSLRNDEDRRAAKGEAVGHGNSSQALAPDGDLQRVIEAWPALSADVRASILDLLDDAT
jgi:hypothetical protein